ncbi:hypothetical protein B5807_04072 [Epicoccum nigrum]|uniref:T6SS Phospholipase effector Tle1-like catalytic domain-containing protein n=1 Tax=Epicoccum nigrum TaxID=105696 RepID=A0A1Y2M4P1_EPING|nr:hypothetical protein B5807_04072 [Epicoccum nigrum]
MVDADTPWGRRLIICCDGTWQSSTTDKQNVPSNVTKLCRLIARYSEAKTDQNKHWHQLVYYDGGIGTGDLSEAESIRQGATGAGLEENIIEAYNFIVLNYEPGDEILCFGFSRGAYTARAVAGLVADIGVLQPLEMQFFHDIYRCYEEYGLDPNGSKSGVSFRETSAWKKICNKNIFVEGPPSEASRNIKVVGVWDTVGSLGVPDILGYNNGNLRKKYGFNNVKLSKHVQHAYHALALDDRRPSFRPTLWYIDPERNKESELKQVWFPGVHINCGGGSDDPFTKMEGDMENISIATFTWMLQCIAPHVDLDQAGFKFYLKQYQNWLKKLRFDCTILHPQEAGGVLDTIWKTASWINPFKSEQPSAAAATSSVAKSHTHDKLYFGWGIGPIDDSYTKMYFANGAPRPRRPGREEMEIEGKWSPIKGDASRPTGFLTNEYIHPLVQHRIETVGWAKWIKWADLARPSPFPLEGWKRKLYTEEDGKTRYYWYSSDGEICLPEWCVLPDTPNEINYERAWYMAALDMGKEASSEGLKAADVVKAAGGKDFLKRLDGEIKWRSDMKPGNTWTPAKKS